MDKKLYSTFHAARILGVTPNTILKWINSGKITATRTLGGHYRIRREKINELLANNGYEESRAVEFSTRRVFKYCWEFNSSDGKLIDDCKNCLVYKTRAKRCYEMSPVPKELGHIKLFCKSECKDCNYYKYAKDQLFGILIISDDRNFLESFSDDGKTFNIKITNNEYECSSIVEEMRPDFAVIDWSSIKNEEFVNFLSNDSRIPFIKIILASDTKIELDYCANKIIGQISKPITVEHIEEFVADISARNAG